MNEVYIFDCMNCRRFYGEQTLTEDGRLLCPNCLAPERPDSPFVEKMKMSKPVAPFKPEEEPANA